MNRIGSVSTENLYLRAMLNDVSTNPGAAIYNKGIINSYVTELNAYHRPDPDDPQRKDISETLYKFTHANSGEERGALQGRLKDMLSEIIKDLIALREKTFVIHNKWTKDVYGTLADNCTTNDRDNYIKGLVNLHEIIGEISSSQHDRPGASVNEKSYTAFIDTIGQFKIVISDLFILHPGTSLYGDLKALFLIMSGSDLEPKIPRMVPYFSHNLSTVTI